MKSLTTPSRFCSRRRSAARIGAIALLIAVASSVLAPSAFAGGPPHYANFDGKLNQLAASGPRSETTSVIAKFTGAVPSEVKQYARPGRPNDNGWHVLDVPNDKLKTIAENSSTIFAVHNDKVYKTNFRTGVQSGAFFARQGMGFTGKGVGVAILDSGIAPNDEFKAWGGTGLGLSGESRVRYFQDFLANDTANACTAATPCDTNGHGTHIAGTIAGNGYNSFGERAGMAPDASIVALRVLGADGTGSLDGVLSALDWVAANHTTYNIRVVNLSFGMVPDGSLPNSNPLDTMLNPTTGDPLAIATKALVDAGIFVVAAAGNVGQIVCKDSAGQTIIDVATGKAKMCDVWGGITAPGTYPWVFTAGANSSNGTLIREDDTRAAFSSRGPGFPLQNAKPDILAGGVGIESTSAPGSTLYQDPKFLLPGSFPTKGGTLPYMVLTGTSQAAAVVSGVAALMLEANPDLTPNLMKAVFEYTAQDEAYNPLEQGAGFLNALGAVQLSQFYKDPLPGQRVPVQPIWSQHFIWGNHELSGGLMVPTANAWAVGVQWGVATTAGNSGDNIVWGTSCGLADCGDNIVWGTSADGDNIVWGTVSDGDNIVWGTSGQGDNIVWGTAAGDDNIVWGTSCGGQDCAGNIVWGTASGDDNIVWGTAEAGDNIVWGTAAANDNIVWGTAADDNIVWGTAGDGDNIVWGTSLRGGQETGVQGTRGVNPSFKWFLNPRHMKQWIQYEFGDSSGSRDGREGSEPTKPNRSRNLSKSHREGK